MGETGASSALSPAKALPFFSFRLGHIHLSTMGGLGGLATDIRHPGPGSYCRVFPGGCDVTECDTHCNHAAHRLHVKCALAVGVQLISSKSFELPFRRWCLIYLINCVLIPPPSLFPSIGCLLTRGTRANFPFESRLRGRQRLRRLTTDNLNQQTDAVPSATSLAV